MHEKYHEALRFLESLRNLPGPSFMKKSRRRRRKFFIKRIDFLLELLGRPEKKLKFIHVTGTAGKGSVTAIAQAILTAAGKKTGGFFSPHVTSVVERIKIGDEFISPEEFASLTERLKPFLDRCALESPYGIPSFFEISLALAFLYFSEEKCEYAVLEVGIGGSFDATNVIRRAEVCVITNIGWDHRDVLGKTKAEIARDKSGIIKPGSRFFTGERSPEMLKIFRSACLENNSEFNRVKFDYQIIKNDLGGLQFKYDDYVFRMRLIGEHQAENAILAIKAVEQIVGNDHSAIKQGVEAATMPARLETMQKNPLVVIDGAHNVAKMKAAAKFIAAVKARKIFLVIALANNKDLSGIFRQIIPLAGEIFLTRFLDAERKSCDLKRMLKAARRITAKKISVFSDPPAAFAAALESAGQDDLIFVTGSFFLAGELRKKWFSEDYILKKRKMI
jgi:dihydrofolate synthase / folylpolyglutamate synthase